MPRKLWTPKCTFAKRSKLSDADFACILLHWIWACSAEETAKAMEASGSRTLSEKTVSAYYKRIGDAVFKAYESLFVQMATLDLGTAPDMEAFYADYHVRATVDPSVDLTMSRLLHIVESAGIEVMDFDAIQIEYRSASVAKRGVAQRIKQTLAWATVREEARSQYRATYKKFTGIDEEISHAIFLSLLSRFEKEPC